jgi:putative PIN family toxin of toxin-antitoxin system
VERVVLDPAVLVSALISSTGHPATLWRAVLDHRVETVVCPRLLAELAGVLERPKFRRYATMVEAHAFVAEVARYGQAVPDPASVPRASRDPDDDYLVALARAAGVGALVSGDRDLTEMADPDPRILTPAQAVDRLL